MKNMENKIEKKLDKIIELLEKLVDSSLEARTTRNSIRCKKCKSTLTYFRKKDKLFVCRACGNIWEKGK